MVLIIFTLNIAAFVSIGLTVENDLNVLVTCQSRCTAKSPTHGFVSFVHNDIKIEFYSVSRSPRRHKFSFITLYSLVLQL